MAQKTIVCISCYFKGYDFMEEMKALGNRVLLITSENLRDKPWPWHAVDEVFYMQEIRPSTWNLEHLVQGFAHLMRREKIDAVIALDDYDVEKAAMIREVFRIAGMGQSTHRYFRDKLAMRLKAKKSDIAAPEFSPVFNDEEVAAFTGSQPAPWVLKPRSEASSTGIRKIGSAESLWENLNQLGEERHLFLIEKFLPGDVFHVDSLVYGGKTVFTCASQYLAPPMEISQQGGVFRTQTLGRKSEEFKALEKLNAKLLKAFGLHSGASHTEFIRSREDGSWYFLETSSRVGGAYIPDMVEAATGVNLWREWAKIEDCVLRGEKYKLKKPADRPAGLIIALTKEEYPDLEPFRDEAVVKFLPIDYHAGIVYQADDAETVRQKLDDAAEEITAHHLNILPPKGKN